MIATTLRYAAGLATLVGVGAWTLGNDSAGHPSARVPRPLNFHLAAAPFPVHDSAGRLLEAAFVGGFNSPRPQLADADGDGDLDLFVQEVPGKIAYFERDGERDGLPRFLFRTDRYSDINAGQWYRFADVDRDGDLDLLTEQRFGYIQYYRNTAKRGAPFTFVFADTLRDTTGKPLVTDPQNIPQLDDLDCNGRADLLVGHATGGTVSRYEAVANVPPDGIPTFRLVAEQFEGIRIIGGEHVERAGSALPIRPAPPLPVQDPPRSPGPSQPPERWPLPVAKPRRAVGRTGAGAQTAQARHGANTMALADVDRDGDLDLFWGDFFEQGLLLIQNTGTCAAPNFRNTPVKFPEADPLATSGYNAPAFGNVTGDDQIDLVIGVLGGVYNPPLTAVENLYYLERTANGGWAVRTHQLVATVDVGSESIPAAVDLDGDGDLDLVVANKEDPANLRMSKIYWFENVGSPTKPALRLRSPLVLRSARPVSDSTNFAPAFGDLDGDGRLDMVLGKFKTALARYERSPDGGFDLVDSVMVRVPSGQTMVPALGDLDGDGDLDLLVGESSGWIDYFRNDGTPRKPRFVLVSEEFDSLKATERSRQSAPHLVDLDRDGDLDLLVGYDGDFALFRNVGSRTKPRFERDTTFTVPAPMMAAPASGDFDGDGDPDLVIGGVSGGLVYLEQR